MNLVSKIAASKPSGFRNSLGCTTANLCMRAPSLGCSKRDESFIAKGSSNWKKASEKLRSKNTRIVHVTEQLFKEKSCLSSVEILGRIC